MNIIHKKNTGFTLIEVLVSVALFSVVLTVTLGSILTIADSNKKARSLMSVTNNLNFAVDSMIRSFKVGEIKDIPGWIGSNCFATNEIDYAEGGFNTRYVQYCFIVDENDLGKITKQTDGAIVALTSPDVDVDSAEFINTSTSQPMLSIIMEGTVKVSERVRSTFSIQTAVSQRKLNL